MPFRRTRREGSGPGDGVDSGGPYSAGSPLTNPRLSKNCYLFWPNGSIAGWRSFAILFIDDAGLLRDSSLICLWVAGWEPRGKRR